MKALIHRVSPKHGAFVRLLRVSSIHFVRCGGCTVLSDYTSTKVARDTVLPPKVIPRANETGGPTRSQTFVPSSGLPLQPFGLVAPFLPFMSNIRQNIHNVLPFENFKSSRDLLSGLFADSTFFYLIGARDEALQAVQQVAEAVLELKIFDMSRVRGSSCS